VNAVKSNTAIGTTATASTTAAGYRGRFAPSPSGLLHLGSVAAALASWLDARSHQGSWLIRMEDLDTPRVVPGAAAAILNTLQQLGLLSDEPIVWQSQRRAAYEAALLQLRLANAAYRCSCSRSDSAGAYSGHCRDRGNQTDPSAWRFRLPAPPLQFTDRWQGPCRHLPEELGDPIIYRRDGLAAYQLAVVVDDAYQQITHVVRGADLLDSTAWQLAIATALGFETPVFAHIPLLLEPDGSKLAKSRRSLPAEQFAPQVALLEALALLHQQPDPSLSKASTAQILDWALAHWAPHRLTGIASIRLPEQPTFGLMPRLY
jgi:glutamyl-Q tRNA(Asp) synthetase